MHFGTTSWSEHGLKMAFILFQSFYVWSNQGVIMLLTYASRTIHICMYWWLFDYLYIDKKKKKKSIAALLWSFCIIVSEQIVASLLSLCMTKWLRKWWRGWRYVRSNAKIAKSLILRHCTLLVKRDVLCLTVDWLINVHINNNNKNNSWPLLRTFAHWCLWYFSLCTVR